MTDYSRRAVTVSIYLYCTSTTTISKCTYSLLRLLLLFSFYPNNKGYRFRILTLYRRWWYPPSHIPPTRVLYTDTYLSVLSIRKRYICTHWKNRKERKRKKEKSILLYSSFLRTNPGQIQLDRSFTIMTIIINRFTIKTTFGRSFCTSLDSFIVKWVISLKWCNTKLKCKKKRTTLE